MTTELKNCPFCDSEKAAVYHDTSSDHRFDWDFHVECTDCGAAGESDKHREEAILAWNRRPALAASGGNAAPWLTIEKINELAAKHIQDICGVGRPAASMGEDHEFVILCRAIEAASAPNAALVAALKDAVSALDDVECDRFNVDMDAVSMAASAGRSALSAAGQEVK